MHVCVNGDLLLGVTDSSSLEGIFLGVCVFAVCLLLRWYKWRGGGRDVRIRKAASLSMLFEVGSERKTPTPFLNLNARIWIKKKKDFSLKLSN